MGGSQISENEEIVDLRSSERKGNANPNSDDFRTLLNFNSKGSSMITAEIMRMLESVITSKVSSNLIEIKIALIFQIRKAIEQAITEQDLPSIQNNLCAKEIGCKTKVDLTCSGRHRSPEVKLTNKAWEITREHVEIFVIKMIISKKTL